MKISVSEDFFNIVIEKDSVSFCLTCYGIKNRVLITPLNHLLYDSQSEHQSWFLTGGLNSNPSLIQNANGCYMGYLPVNGVLAVVGLPLDANPSEWCFIELSKNHYVITTLIGNIIYFLKIYEDNLVLDSNSYSTFNIKKNKVFLQQKYFTGQ